jgi:4-amino-4-deoxy-L-arabinose transferase-like glycosyltransferase
MERKRAWLYALAGLLWGVCSLVRPTTQFLPPLIFLLSLLPSYRQWLRPAALLLACFVLVQSPWRLRNMSLPADHAQQNMTAIFLTFGTYPGFMYQGRPETVGYPYRFDPEAERSQQDVPHALAYIVRRFREAPIEMTAWTLIGKPISFLSWSNPDGDHDILIFPVTHNPFDEDRRLRMIREGMFWSHWPLMLFGVAGLCLLAFYPKRLALDGGQLGAARIMAAVFAYALVFHVIGAPLPRYGVPFRPMLFPMALLAVAALWPRRVANGPGDMRRQ